jgi:hypothetical protein
MTNPDLGSKSRSSIRPIYKGDDAFTALEALLRARDLPAISQPLVAEPIARVIRNP